MFIRSSASKRNSRSREGGTMGMKTTPIFFFFHTPLITDRVVVVGCLFSLAKAVTPYRLSLVVPMMKLSY